MSGRGTLLAGLRRSAATAAPALVGFGAFVVAWWAAIAFLAPTASLLARFGPAEGISALLDLMTGGQLWGHVTASLRRIVVGLSLAAAIGIPLGLALGSFRLFGRTTGPVLGLVRMISPLSWTPIAIIIFGVGDAPVYFLVAIGAIWPIALNTAAGIAALDPTWLVVARSLSGSPWEVLRHVVWPGIRPNVLTGLRLATGLAWIILVPAEMLGVDSGLGYFILDTRDRFAYDELVAGIVVIGMLGLGLDTLARLAFALRRRASTRQARPVGGRAERPTRAVIDEPARQAR